MAKFTERILKLASYVGQGETVADVGPDHGYLGIWLVKNGISPRVIMTDIAEGPLSIARANAERYVPRAVDVMDFRLGDGLVPLGCGEVDTVVIAGMGGETIIAMLDADIAKAGSFAKYIFQPRTKAELLRRWLKDAHCGSSGKRCGFEIIAEDTAAERGRDCEIIVAGQETRFNMSVAKKELIEV